MQREIHFANYFSYSEAAEYGIHYGDPSPSASMLLEKLESTILANQQEALIAIHSGLFSFNDEHELVLREKFVNEVYDLGALPILLSFLNRLFETLPDLAKNNDINKTDLNYLLKCLLDIIFVVCITRQEDPNLIESVTRDHFLEEILFRGIHLSMDISFIPIRKIVCLLIWYLNAIFGEKPERFPGAQQYITKEYLESMTKATPRFQIKDPNSVELFYRRCLMKSDNPLAQTIVVGLLRALLTACNPAPVEQKQYGPGHSGSKGAHQPAAQANCVDIHEEWRTGLDVLIRRKREGVSFEHLPQYYKELLEEYEESLDELAGELNDEEGEAKNFTRIQEERDRHRIQVVYSISSLFLLLLKRLKSNCLLQFVYVSQLIADANGILVLLKFLTEKFETLMTSSPNIFSPKHEESPIKGYLEDSALNLLRLLYLCCDGHPEKIKSYLVEYSAYYIIKKIPTMFKGNSKIEKYSLYLLRLQIKQFHKKMKAIPSNMKIISEVYGKAPAPYQKLYSFDGGSDLNTSTISNNSNISIASSASFKLPSATKEKIYLNDKTFEYFAQDEIRKINAEFNHIHYWAFKAKMGNTGELNDLGLTPNKTDGKKKRREESNGVEKTDEGYKFLTRKQAIFQKMWQEVNPAEEEYKNYEKWLEDNLWDYYD